MRSLFRHSLRRYVHSLPHVAPPRRMRDSAKFAIGTSFAVAGYVGWRIAANDQRIALDAPPTSQRADTAADTPKTARSAPLGPPVQVEPERVDPPENAERASAPEEAEEGESAFNPVTGEINWDCPCLGGMAHGPCGQQFREAFSCFVFSENEPKGIDCVDKFKSMQDCFREHPDIYGEEIADEDEAPELSSAEDVPSHPEPSHVQSDTIKASPLSEDMTRARS